MLWESKCVGKADVLGKLNCQYLQLWQAIEHTTLSKEPDRLQWKWTASGAYTENLATLPPSMDLCLHIPGSSSGRVRRLRVSSSSTDQDRCGRLIVSHVVACSNILLAPCATRTPGNAPPNHQKPLPLLPSLALFSVRPGHRFPGRLVTLRQTLLCKGLASAILLMPWMI